MKFPNHTKKRETRATLNTFKIMSLTKRDEISEYQIGQTTYVAKNSVRRKVRDPTMIWLHIIRRRTSLFKNWQSRRR
jgi:hypothetical protein